MKFSYHQEDILKFKVTNNFIATGSLDGTLTVCNKHSGKLLSIKYKAHSSVINSIDCLHQRFMVTGSKDRNAKIWKLDFEGGHFNSDSDVKNESPYNCSLTCSQSIGIGDRVLSVSCSQERDWVAIGSAGCAIDKTIFIFDVLGNRMIGTLNDEHRHGAGVLGIQWEDSNTLLSCGYDTLIRLWDLRSPGGKCVLKWEDPHDSAIYCLATDHWVTILSGTCRHGVVRLWDKRRAKHCVQMYYGGRENSPVYSLDFDPCYLYIALDKSINLMNFRMGSHAKNHC
uniref:Uncharacterized protein n=2 Tax=Tetranychus urticae TaxID=32264 RepID=T1JRL8_TETUR